MLSLDYLILFVFITLIISDLQILIHRVCDLLSPPVSSIAFGPRLDPKHSQPILLHRVEDQLAYSYEAMDKFMVWLLFQKGDWEMQGYELNGAKLF